MTDVAGSSSGYLNLVHIEVAMLDSTLESQRESLRSVVAVRRFPCIPSRADPRTNLPTGARWSRNAQMWLSMSNHAGRSARSRSGLFGVWAWPPPLEGNGFYFVDEGLVPAPFNKVLFSPVCGRRSSSGRIAQAGGTAWFSWGWPRRTGQSTRERLANPRTTSADTRARSISPASRSARLFPRRPASPPVVSPRASAIAPSTSTGANPCRMPASDRPRAPGA